MRRIVAAFALTTMPLASALAGMGPIPGEERFQNLIPSTEQSMAAELGYAKIGEDHFVRLTLNTELNLGPVGLGLQVPLNLRVWDQDPQNTGDYYGMVREEDWDEKSEWVKVIRYVRLGHKRDDMYLRVGELAADIGHGTIMNRYLNNLDVNTFRLGSSFDVNTDYGGFETVISDFGTLYDTASPESRLVGFRGYFKPYALLDSESVFNVFSVGVSFVSDFNAPAGYEMVQRVDENGTPLTDPATGEPLMARQVDERGNLVVSDTTRAMVWGLDAEVELLHNALVDLVPYTDLNFVSDGGWGWHAGVLTTFKMPVGFALTIPVRLEYRRFKSDYAPAFFNTFYEVERYSYLSSATTGTEADPKIVAVRRGGETALSGYYGDLAFDFAGILQVGAVYEDYEGGNPNLQAFAAVPALETVQLKAYYARTGITGTDDIFAFDDRSMAVAEGRYELFSYVYLVGRLTRRWALVTDTTAADYGEYAAHDDWKFGLEMALTF